MKTMYRRKQQNGKVEIVDYDDTILPSTFVDRWKIEQSTDLPQHVSFDSSNLYIYRFRCWAVDPIRSQKFSVIFSIKFSFKTC